jgi:hypothetical protein
MARTKSEEAKPTRSHAESGDEEVRASFPDPSRDRRAQAAGMGSVAGPRLRRFGGRRLERACSESVGGP